MNLRDLFGRHRGQTIYIVGTGPSMRCFPRSVLAGKTTIGLNQAFHYFKPTYSLTVHPDVIDTLHVNCGQWLVKPKGDLTEASAKKAGFCVFHTFAEPDGPHDLSFVRGCVRHSYDQLYLGRGIQCTAMHLAEKMGATDIALVGCDHTDLAGEHHGHDQHVRWLGVEPARVYREYRHYTAMMRRVLREERGIHTFTLSPFVGLDAAAEDFERLRKEMDLPPLPPPRDLSPYIRPAGKVG